MVLDIVGLQLSVPELIWTIINFFLLLFLLKIFLYDPVLKFMDERNERIAAGLEEGRNAEKALNEGKKVLDAELAKTGGEARVIVSRARAEAEKAKSEVLDNAHAEAAKVHSDVCLRIETEESEAKAAVSDCMPELVAILTDKLLRSDEAAQEKDLITSCIGENKE